MSGSAVSIRVGEQESCSVLENYQAALEVLSQDGATSTTPASRDTQHSTTTTATTAEIANLGVQHGGAGQNLNLGTGNAAGALLPPQHPLTTAAIGAQFTSQLQPIRAALTPHEQYRRRLARMTEFRATFLALAVHVSDEILERTENVNYDMRAPETILGQLAAMYPQEDPMTRWQLAEDIWNAVSMQVRPIFPDSGILYGWDDLEQLPFTG